MLFALCQHYPYIGDIKTDSKSNRIEMYKYEKHKVFSRWFSS